MSQQPQEIERKYLIDLDTAKEQIARAKAKKDIKQAYLAVDDQREVRLRSINDRHYRLTVKSSGALSREEIEIELNGPQMERMKPLMGSRCLQKTRYDIPYYQRNIELDIYHGPLEGLAVAEIEFEHEHAAAAFVPPEWFGRELTEDQHFKNKNLVKISFRELPL